VLQNDQQLKEETDGRVKADYARRLGVNCDEAKRGREAFLNQGIAEPLLRDHYLNRAASIDFHHCDLLAHF
jgi:hypothetical protein